MNSTHDNPSTLGERIKDWSINHAYRNRSVWLDIPWALLLYMAFQEYFSRGEHATPQGYVYVCYALYGLYIILKEGPIKRKLRKHYHRRWGGILALSWLGSLCFFYWHMSRHNDLGYFIPDHMVWTTFIILGSYLGIKFIPFGGLLEYVRAAIEKSTKSGTS